MKKSQIALLVVVIAIAAIYFFVPSVKSYIDSSVSTLSSFDLNAVYHYLQSYEHKDVIAVVSFFLMILQSIIAPRPAIFDHSFKRSHLWLGVGCLAVVELGDGRGCDVLLYR